MESTDLAPRCYIGLTQWQHSAWQDNLLVRPKNAHVLGAYSQYFSSVEGNTTFYGLPKAETVKQWNKETPEQFRFCFKLPQTITHKHQLLNSDVETQEFLDRIAPLTTKLGLLCIQLPATFSGTELQNLSDYLDSLPSNLNFAVEVRHPDFFAKGTIEREFNQLLAAKKANRISFDTRSLFAHPATDPISSKAKEHKPQLPVHAIATADNPMVRLITPMDWKWAESYLQPWLKKVVNWLDEGRSPYLFFHTPDNAEAPQLAAYFVEQLEKVRPGSCYFSPWPEQASQDSLF